MADVQKSKVHLMIQFVPLLFILLQQVADRWALFISIKTLYQPGMHGIYGLC